MKLALAVLAAVLGAWTFGVASAAPIAQGEMTIDWTSLTITAVSDGSGAVPFLTWFNQTTSANAHAASAMVVGDWTAPVSAAVGVGPTRSYSDAGAASLYAYAEDSNTVGASGTGIWTTREGQFTVAGSGTVHMAVDYAWHLVLDPGTGGINSFAYAFASLGAETHYDPRGTSNRSGYDEVNLQLSGLFPSDTGSFAGHGTLQFDVPVVDRDLFYFTARASGTANVSAVPMPSSAGLWAVGLGVIGYRMRPRLRGI